MSEISVSMSEVRKTLMEDKEFVEEYNKLKPRYDFISQIIEERIKQNLTQEELALKAGTQKSNISRLENGSFNPSLDFIVKIANSLGKKVSLTLQ